MTKPSLLLFILLSFFALGQNNSVILFDNAEQLMETTLINDTKFYQPDVKLEVDKSQEHSLTQKKKTTHQLH